MERVCGSSGIHLSVLTSSPINIIGHCFPMRFPLQKQEAKFLPWKIDKLGKEMLSLS